MALGCQRSVEKKLEVIKERILDINPEAKITLFEKGVQRENISGFLEGVDLYLDGLDFFVLDQRLWLFRELQAKGIPGITVAPIGMGASLVVFTKDSMPFEKYFGYAESHSPNEKALRFLLGVTPTLIQRHYQVDPSRVNFTERKVPSMPCGVYLCAGVAGTMALKLLTGRGPVLAAPWSLHYDAYLQTYKKRYIFCGFANPLQKIKLMILRRIVLGKNQS